MANYITCIRIILYVKGLGMMHVMISHSFCPSTSSFLHWRTFVSVENDNIGGRQLGVPILIHILVVLQAGTTQSGTKGRP